jgi:CTP-dependent riboflavin kinase
MRILTGDIVDGVGDFRQRMTAYAHVFERATGERLFPGTLNVRVSEPVAAVEHFRIIGAEIGEPEQDLLFEICRINGVWAYRIRPFNLYNGSGGHGDHILEIAAAQELRPALGRAPVVEVALFRTAVAR